MATGASPRTSDDEVVTAGSDTAISSADLSRSELRRVVASWAGWWGGCGVTGSQRIGSRCDRVLLVRLRPRARLRPLPRPRGTGSDGSLAAAGVTTRIMLSTAGARAETRAAPDCLRGGGLWESRMFRHHSEVPHPQGVLHSPLESGTDIVWRPQIRADSCVCRYLVRESPCLLAEAAV